MHVSLSIMIFQIPLNPLFLMQGHLLVVPIFLKTVLLTLLNFVYIVPMSWLIKKALLQQFKIHTNTHTRVCSVLLVFELQERGGFLGSSLGLAPPSPPASCFWGHSRCCMQLQVIRIFLISYGISHLDLSEFGMTPKQRLQLILILTFYKLSLSFAVLHGLWEAFGHLLI